MSLLKVTNLNKAFGGVLAINDLTFEVENDLVYAVIGPNGAGKTTLFNMLCGIYTPTEGTIDFQETTLVGKQPHEVAALGVSRTFQNLQVFFNMTVLENVMVGCHLRSKNGLYRAAVRWPGVIKEEKQIRQWAADALEFCGLAHLADRESTALPYGELKRMEIARARDATKAVVDGRTCGWA